MARSRKSNKAKNTGAQSDDPQDQLETQEAPENSDKLEAASADETAEQEVSSEDAKVSDDAEVGEDTPDVVEASDDPGDAIKSEESEVPAEDVSSADDADNAPVASDEAVEAETLETADDSAEVDGQTPDDENAEASDVENDEASEGDEVTADAETAEDAEPEPVEIEEKPEPRPEPKREPEVAQSSMWPAVFGGVIAAGVGFIASQYLMSSEQTDAVEMAVVEELLTAQAAVFEAQLAERAAEIEAQAARIDTLEASGGAGASGPDYSDAIATLQSEIAVIASQVAGIEGAPAAPSVDPGQVTALQDAMAAQEAQIAAQEAQVAAQEAQIAELAERASAAEANAETEAARILASAALLSVVTAMDSGEPFAGALGELDAVSPVDVPPALSAAAEAGVPTTAELQEAFPDAARAALRAARSDIPEGESATITAFLQRQLNVRSVVPREGDDADAVLSRAEAAVRSGDIALALTELEALPEEASAVMNEWIEAAVARQAAKDAANALADSLSSN